MYRTKIVIEAASPWVRLAAFRVVAWVIFGVVNSKSQLVDFGRFETIDLDWSIRVSASHTRSIHLAGNTVLLRCA
jgi:hypothetical protein